MKVLSKVAQKQEETLVNNNGETIIIIYHERIEFLNGRISHFSFQQKQKEQIEDELIITIEKRHGMVEGVYNVDFYKIEGTIFGFNQENKQDLIQKESIII